MNFAKLYLMLNRIPFRGSVRRNIKSNSSNAAQFIKIFMCKIKRHNVATKFTPMNINTHKSEYNLYYPDSKRMK